MQTTTRANTLTKVTLSGWAMEVTLGGYTLGSVDVREDSEWDGESSDRYEVTSESGSEWLGEWSDVRDYVATSAKEMRTDAMAEQEDAANDALTSLLETHHDAGTSVALLKRLRALGVA